MVGEDGRKRRGEEKEFEIEEKRLKREEQMVKDREELAERRKKEEAEWREVVGKRERSNTSIAEGVEVS